MPLVQKNGGTVSANASIATSLGSATTAGNTILIFANCGGTISTPSGFTSRSPQVNSQGCYLFEKLVASGNSTDTPTLTTGGAYNTIWQIAEYSNITAYDTSSGNNGGVSAPFGPWSTPSITPASGNKRLVAFIVSDQSSSSFLAGDPQGWTNNFVGQQSIFLAGPGGAGLVPRVSGWAECLTSAGGNPYSTSASIGSVSGTIQPASIIAAYTTTDVPPVNSWPTFRSLSSVAYASHTNTVVTAPTGIVDGDILILGFAVGAASPPSVTLPAGFTLVGGSAQRAGAGGFNVDQYVAWKRASSESGSYTITHATASSNAFISVYSGCIATGSPIDTFARNVGTGTLTDTTNCVTSVANTMAVYIDHDWQGSGTRSPPTPMAERYENLEYSCDNPLLPAGSSGQVNATNGNNPGDPWGAWVIILLPASQAPAALVAPLSRAKLWLRPWQYQHIPAASISAGTVAYTMPAAVGAITLAGTATGLRAARILTAVTGAITLAGTATGLRAARILTAATGAIVLAGSAANLIYATTKTLIASTGSIVVAGTATGLRAARQLAATKGSITLAGTLTGLKFGRVLTAAKGSIVLAGLATGLRAARTLTAAKGSIVLTGFAAGLIQSSLKTLLATTGSIVLGGQAVTLRYARKLVVAKGTITLAGSLAALVRGRGLGAGTGAIVVAGQNVNLVHPVSYRMRADYSSIRVAGPEGRLSRSGTEQPGVLEFGRTAYLGRW